MAVPASSRPDARVSPMFSYCRVERDRIERPEADQIVEVIREVRRFDRGAIAGKPLFDADVEPARPLGLRDPDCRGSWVTGCTTE